MSTTYGAPGLGQTAGTRGKDGLTATQVGLADS